MLSKETPTCRKSVHNRKSATAKVAFWLLKQAVCLVLVISFNTGKSGCKEEGEKKKNNHISGLIRDNYFYISSMICLSETHGTKNAKYVIKLLFLKKKTNNIVLQITQYLLPVLNTSLLPLPKFFISVKLIEIAIQPFYYS